MDTPATLTFKSAAVVLSSLLWLSEAYAQASGLQAGQTAPNFTLPSVSGNSYSLYSRKGAAGYVIVFISTQCPVSNSYNSRYIKLADLAKQGLMDFVAINPNATEPLDEVKAHAAEKTFPFPVLKDAGAKVADAFGATVTPEAFFLDADFRLVYRGRIDDNQREEKATSKDLEEALAAYLGGMRTANKYQPPKGCIIKKTE